MSPGPGLPIADPQVVHVELRRVAVPLVGARRAAHGEETVRESILVGVSDDAGTTGWGECVALSRPTYTGEWTAGAWGVLTRLVAPGLLAGSLPALVGHPMAIGSIRDALLDLALQDEGRSLAAALGSGSRVASRAVLGLEPGLDELERAVADRLAAGHRSVKLKVTPATAVAAVARVRDRWPDLDIAVDANGSFDLHDHASVLAGLDDAGLSYVEQPLPADDLVGHAELRRRSSTRIALDESVASVGALRAAQALGALDLVNVKPGRVGGVRAAGHLLAAMAAGEVGGFVGGMYELGIGRSTALAVAASPVVCDQPCDLGPTDAYVAADVTAPFDLDADGCIDVPVVPGIGRRPDPDRLDELTVDVVHLRR